MNKLDILKGASEILTSIGVSAIVGNVIKMTADPEGGRIKKIAIGVGGFVLSSMVADKAVDYANERIDSTAEKLSKIFKPKDAEENVVIFEEDLETFRATHTPEESYQKYLDEQDAIKRSALGLNDPELTVTHQIKADDIRDRKSKTKNTKESDK